MPKAYWIVHVTVHDEEHYPEYLAAAIPVFEKYGANFIVRNGPFEVMEGATRQRNFVIEFKDRATAMECYTCAEYQAAKASRQKYSDGDFVIIDGAEWARLYSLRCSGEVSRYGPGPSENAKLRPDLQLPSPGLCAIGPGDPAAHRLKHYCLWNTGSATCAGDGTVLAV